MLLALNFRDSNLTPLILSRCVKHTTFLPFANFPKELSTEEAGHYRAARVSKETGF